MMRFLCISLLAMLIGCAGRSATHESVEQPPTATGRPPYWLQKPAAASVQSTDFDALWCAQRRGRSSLRLLACSTGRISAPASSRPNR